MKNFNSLEREAKMVFALIVVAAVVVFGSLAYTGMILVGGSCINGCTLKVGEIIQISLGGDYASFGASVSESETGNCTGAAELFNVPFVIVTMHKTKVTVPEGKTVKVSVGYKNDKTLIASMTHNDGNVNMEFTSDNIDINQLAMMSGESMEGGFV